MHIPDHCDNCSLSRIVRGTCFGKCEKTFAVGTKLREGHSAIVEQRSRQKVPYVRIPKIYFGLIAKNEKLRFVRAKTCRANGSCNFKLRRDRNVSCGIIYLRLIHIRNAQFPALAWPSQIRFGAFERGFCPRETRWPTGSNPFQMHFAERDGKLVVRLFRSVPLPNKEYQSDDQRRHQI